MIRMEIKLGKANSKVYDFFGNPTEKKFITSEIQLRLSLLMINEAVVCFEDGIIESAEDGILVLFLNRFRPFTGGLFRYIDSVGASNIVSDLNRLKEAYGTRFTPSQLLNKYAKNTIKFYK